MSKNENFTKAAASVSMFHFGRCTLTVLSLCSGGERRNRDVFIVRIQGRILQIKGPAEIILKVLLEKKALNYGLPIIIIVIIIIGIIVLDTP